MSCLLFVPATLVEYPITSYGQVCNFVTVELIGYLCWLGNHSDVEKITLLAVRHGVCVIPFGGGTNVSGALECPVDERRTIVSLDMTQMVRISIFIFTWD